MTQEQVTQFATSIRGQYILSQALCLAIEKLNEVEPEHMREQSNIADMEYLRDELFPMHKAVQDAEHDQEENWYVSKNTQRDS